MHTIQCMKKNTARAEAFAGTSFIKFEECLQNKKNKLLSHDTTN